MQDVKIFRFLSIKKDYDSLLKSLKDCSFFEENPDFDFVEHFNIYLISNNKSKCCVFKNIIKVNIHLQNSDKVNSFPARSNLDIESYCEKNGIDRNALYLSKNVQYKKDNLFFLNGAVKNNELNFILLQKKELDKCYRSSLLQIGQDYTVKDYSRFYKFYFGEEVSADSIFNYEETEERELIFQNLNILMDDSEIKNFKFTGPFSIGKSITLLRFSRMASNIIYINLKLFMTKNEWECFSALQEEFQRISPYLFDDVQKKIGEEYKKGEKPLNALYNIIKFIISENTKNPIFVLILDQYKESFEINKIKALEEEKNINIVYCSSINNKDMRDNCIETWKEFADNPRLLTKKNQKFFFYFSNIYSLNITMDDSILTQINKIPRFKKLSITKNTPKEKIEAINKHVIEKLEEFCSKIDVSLDYLLVTLKNIIGKKYSIKNKLNKVIEFVPLKYFIVEFIKNEEFTVKLQFPFFKQIINRRLLVNEVEDYFKNEKYLKNIIENDLVKGDYFEEAVKIGLKNKNFLPQKWEYSVMLEEIASMEKVDKDELDLDYLEKESKNSEKKGYLNLNKYYQMDIDDTENILNKSSENLPMIIEQNYSNDAELENLNKVLKKFSIYADKNNKKNNNLEGYRNAEINTRISNKLDIEIPEERKYNGNKNYFLEQRNKKGRTIDCAYLYGNNDKKTFIGFQIKCYFSSTKELNRKAWDKDLIRVNLQKILINSMVLFDCKIINWYYYLIFYINPGISKCNVSEEIIKKYKNKIEILFYDPLIHKFYNCENMHINKLELTKKSNLDYKQVNFLESILDQNLIFDKFEINSKPNEDEAKECFLKDFIFLGNDIDKILTEISVIMEIKDEKLYLKNKIKKTPYIPDPHFNYIFIYALDNGQYIGAKSWINDPKSLIRYYDIKERKEIDLFKVRGACEYFYIIKRKITRVYNKLRKLPMEKILECKPKPKPKKSRSLSK